MPYYYLTIFLIISFFALAESVSIESRVKRFGLLLVFFLLTLTAGLRYETGVDWRIYSGFYSLIPPIDQIVTKTGRAGIFHEIDLGYDVFTSTIKYCGGSIQTVFFLVSVLSSFFLFKSLKKYTPYPLNSILVYYGLLYFMLDMSGLRQALALAIFLFSCQYIHERKFYRFFLLIVLATLFHWSSIVLLPLYFVCSRRLSLFTIVAFMIPALIIFFFSIRWLDAIITLILPFFSNESLLTKGYIYTTTTEFTGGWKLNLTTIFNISLSLAILILLITYRQELETRFKYFNLFFNLFFIQLVIYFSCSELPEIAERMKLFFVVANVILLPYFIPLFRITKDRIFAFCCIALYAFALSRTYLLERSATIAYHPYQNYIIYKAFDIPSTGNARLEQHIINFSNY